MQALKRNLNNSNSIIVLNGTGSLELHKTQLIIDHWCRFPNESALLASFCNCLFKISVYPFASQVCVLEFLQMFYFPNIIQSFETFVSFSIFSFFFQICLIFSKSRLCMFVRKQMENVINRCFFKAFIIFVLVCSTLTYDPLVVFLTVHYLCSGCSCSFPPFPHVSHCSTYILLTSQQSWL